MKRIMVCSGFLLMVALISTAAAQTPVTLTSIQELGKALFFDATLSLNNDQSCSSCHSPAAGFADPDKALPVSQGSTAKPPPAPAPAPKFGGRNAPSAAYAAFAPVFHYDAGLGLYVGGQFWDGRQDSLAGQAAGPFLNPVEMMMPSKLSVIQKLAVNPDYIAAFNNPNVFGDDIIDLTEAVLSSSGVLAAYDRMAKAIGEYEKTRELNLFNSRYDLYLAGLGTLTPNEQKGLKLFEGKAKCALCHLSRPAVAPDGSVMPPMLTDFTYDNLGMPVNPEIAVLIGATQPIDYGLGARADVAARDPMIDAPNGLGGTVTVSAGQAGKFKVMPLRNIAETAPYGHNGYFQSLEAIVHFYNTRDLLPACDTIVAPQIPAPGQNCWPAPEVALNMNVTELGNLGLTPTQEAYLVAFLKTLSDQAPGVPSPFFPTYTATLPTILPVPMP